MATNAELKARQAAAVAQGVATKAIYAARAENAELWDVEGRRNHLRVPVAGVGHRDAGGGIDVAAGTHANVVRLLPPLTIPFEVLEEGLDILEAAIEGGITKTAAAA